MYNSGWCLFQFNSNSDRGSSIPFRFQFRPTKYRPNSNSILIPIPSTDFSLQFNFDSNSANTGAVHKLCYAEEGRGVWPRVTIGLFSELSQSKFWPTVLHGGRGAVKNCPFWRNIIYGWPPESFIVCQKNWPDVRFAYCPSMCAWLSCLASHGKYVESCKLSPGVARYTCYRNSIYLCGVCSLVTTWPNGWIACCLRS